MARPRRRSATAAVPLSLLLPLAAAALLLAYSPSAHSRQLLSATTGLESLPISDGIGGTSSRFLSPYLQLRRVSAGEQCEQTYGVMPCTTTAVGNLFLLLVYGFLMFQAAKYLSNGSEMLLQILGPGIVGGLFLPILGALPDAILIFVSGISGTKEEAQGQVLIGMGLLAGSTVMLLTLLWGTCVVVGSTELVDGRASEGQSQGEPRKLSLFGSGISTDVQTSYASRIMVISIIPFVIMQLPKIFKSPSWNKWTVLVALVLAVVFLLSYCMYQIYQPWIQKRRLAYAKLKHVISGILKHAHSEGFGRLLHEDGTPNADVIEKLFHKIDRDDDGSVSRDELYALIIGIQFDVMDLDRDDAVDHVMTDFDTNHNKSIDKQEFAAGISRWILAAKSIPVTDSSKDFIHDFHDRTRQEHDMLAEEGEEEVEHVENPTWITLTAVLYLLLGTVIAVLFADPLVDAVDNFSDATHIPSFFISFIAMPLATNSSEAVSALIFASRKKLRTSSLTFSEIYGAVTMNNTLCLAVFLALVYMRGLTWDFSSEVLIILIVCVVMGLFSSFRTTFPLWTSSVAYVLYPFSLALVYILDYKFGWS